MSKVMFSVRRRDLAWAMALVMLLSAVWVARSDPADGVVVPPGLGIARVYVAVGTNYPDALGVGPGGGVNGAPIIILPTNPPIPGPSEAELVRLDPREVVIIGGTGVISTEMQTALETLLPNAVVRRIAGANRYETNSLFSQESFPLETWISVPGSAFTAGQPDLEDAATGYYAVNASTGRLYAPITLPHGAEVLELKVMAYDADLSNNLEVYLIRVDLEVIVDIVAGVETGDGSGFQTVSELSISSDYEIVDNGNYAYMLDVYNAGETDGTDPYVVNVMVRVRLGAP